MTEILRPTVRPGRIPSHTSGRFDRRVLLVVVLAVPLGYFNVGFGGFTVGGWAWTLVAVVSLFGLLAHPVSPAALRPIAPYLVFLTLCGVSVIRSPDLFEAVKTLGQYLTPLLVYLVAWRVRFDYAFLALIRKIAAIEIGIAVAATLVFGADGAGWFSWLQPLVPGTPFEIQTRVVIIGMVALFVLGTFGRPTSRVPILLGIGVLALAVLTGSRTATGVMIVLVLTTPDIKVSWKVRVAGTSLAVVLVGGAIIQSSYFQERFFYSDSGGSISDIVEGGENFDTSGRYDAWPKILEICNQEPILGSGVGSAYTITRSISDDVLEQPHNEYIRVYCETGLVGSMVFWFFFLFVAYRSWLVIQRHRSWTGKSALQLAVAFMFIGLTDNPLVYTTMYMAPAFIALAWMDREFAFPTDGRYALPPRIEPLSIRPHGEPAAEGELLDPDPSEPV